METTTEMLVLIIINKNLFKESSQMESLFFLCLENCVNVNVSFLIEEHGIE